MERKLVPIVLALIALALTPAVASSGGSKTVKVDDNFFAPSSLAVRKGTKVRFKWVGDNKHNVVKAKGPGRSFESKPLEGRGVLFKHRFSKPGRYRLACTLHERMKMSLRVKRKRTRG